MNNMPTPIYTQSSDQPPPPVPLPPPPPPDPQDLHDFHNLMSEESSKGKSTEH